MPSICLESCRLIYQCNNSNTCECANKNFCLICYVLLLFAQSTLCPSRQNSVTNVGQYRSLISVRGRTLVCAKNKGAFGHPN